MVEKRAESGEWKRVNERKKEIKRMHVAFFSTSEDERAQNNSAADWESIIQRKSFMHSLP